MRILQTSTFLFLITISWNSFSQQTENFGYILKGEKISKHGCLFIENPDTTKKSKTPIINQSFPNCDLISINADTLKLIFWDIIGTRNQINPLEKETLIYGSEYNGQYCYLHIDKWDSIHAYNLFTFSRYHRQGIRIPFRYFGISVLQLPFRIVPTSDEIRLESEFLNINLAGLWHMGHSRIYRNSRIPVSTREFGFGPFIGLRAIPKPTQLSDGFGFNYGFCSSFSLNKLQILLGVGAETDFGKNGNPFMRYISFGIGYELFAQFSPEIKTE